ncbi:unnamed protein product [Lasius platythorax]|uniref:SAP domain-containing protein n=1 Tax=Lasius platythorax TaxID=488582 RepID=A0AAV2MZ80_9HYME
MDELMKRLEQLGLQTTGTKAILHERLRKAWKERPHNWWMAKTITAKGDEWRTRRRKYNSRSYRRNS